MSPQSKREQDRHVGVRLSPYLHLRLTEMAKKYNATLSVVIRALLTRAIDEISIEKEDDGESD
jgi:predicted DNA-binding protein